MKYKILSVLGRVWIVFSLAIIFLGYFQAYDEGGINELTSKILSFKFTNLLGIVITLAPGIVLLLWAKSIKKES